MSVPCFGATYRLASMMTPISTSTNRPQVSLCVFISDVDVEPWLNRRGTGAAARLLGLGLGKAQSWVELYVRNNT